MSEFARAFYGNPAAKMKMIGITGTNGKTTTAHMLASILNKAGKNCALIGTLGVFYANREIAPALTTPDPIFLHKTFADMVECGVEYVVMEVSAHAVYFDKIEGIRFACCIFTNCTEDHLDFFKDMESYAAAKRACSRPSAAIWRSSIPTMRWAPRSRAAKCGRTAMRWKIPRTCSRSTCARACAAADSCSTCSTICTRSICI